MIYEFIDNKGSFRVKNPWDSGPLYFPLTNKKGSLLSSISPNLAGDIKKDNEHFLTPPAGIEDISHNLLCRREFFLNITSQRRILRLSSPAKDVVEAGILFHKVIKDINPLRAEILNFIPWDSDAEVMMVSVENIQEKDIEIQPVSFIPLYGRSELNLRDHRHVTSLLNRISIHKSGIFLSPTMVFNEEKHRKNKTIYFSYGCEDNNVPFTGQFPTLESFYQGALCPEKPKAVYGDHTGHTKNLPVFQGKEACAAFKFRKIRLKKGQKINYILITGICRDRIRAEKTFIRLNSPGKVMRELKKTRLFWQSTLSGLTFSFKDPVLDNWLLWVNLQPTLRKLFGCSFLPHFDYGKGGRGFRDLWQDILSLILKNDGDVKNMILKNFASIRIDGSNATIINRQGDFLSDRNKITRIWSDHGIWPLITTNLYLQRSNDFEILFKRVPYFRDQHIKRCEEMDPEFSGKKHSLKTAENKTYQGTVLEHLIVENLIPFFNVGRHNLLRLENGDWNDGLDMAPDKGECAPFYAMYGHNMIVLAGLLEKISTRYPKIEIFQELSILTKDSLIPGNYDSPGKKQKILRHFLEKTKKHITGKTDLIKTDCLAENLRKKGNWILDYVSKKQWLPENFFNGYYDNNSSPVEGKHNNRIYLLLQTQVFFILSGAADKKQIEKTWKTVNKYLFDKKLNGFHLNTDFKTIYLELGRAFGFSYGDKENGAFFNHMVILLAFALYQHNFTSQGNKVLDSVYKMSLSENAKIYPTIPEYFNMSGKGLYSYLTGSASWYVYTLFSKVLGINFQDKDIIISPQLTDNDFKNSRIEVLFSHIKRKIKIIFKKEKNSDIYSITRGILNKKTFYPENNHFYLKASDISALPLKTPAVLTLYLS